MGNCKKHLEQLKRIRNEIEHNFIYEIQHIALKHGEAKYFRDGFVNGFIGAAFHEIVTDLNADYSSCEKCAGFDEIPTSLSSLVQMRTAIDLLDIVVSDYKDDIEDVKANILRSVICKWDYKEYEDIAKLIKDYQNVYDEFLSDMKKYAENNGIKLKQQYPDSEVL